MARKQAERDTTWDEDLGKDESRRRRRVNARKHHRRDGKKWDDAPGPDRARRRSRIASQHEPFVEDVDGTTLLEEDLFEREAPDLTLEELYGRSEDEWT